MWAEALACVRLAQAWCPKDPDGKLILPGRGSLLMIQGDIDPGSMTENPLAQNYECILYKFEGDTPPTINHERIEVDYANWARFGDVVVLVYVHQFHRIYAAVASSHYYFFYAFRSVNDARAASTVTHALHGVGGDPWKITETRLTRELEGPPPYSVRDGRAFPIALTAKTMEFVRACTVHEFIPFVMDDGTKIAMPQCKIESPLRNLIPSAPSAPSDDQLKRDRRGLATPR